MLTTGPAYGEAIGELEGEPLYHASLAAEDYRDLLAASGFEVVEHRAEDPDCGGRTVWLAQLTALGQTPAAKITVAPSGLRPSLAFGHGPRMTPRKSLLIIDDDDDLRGEVAEQLELQGEFTVAQAALGEDGLAQAQAVRPDLILLDLDLPDIDGREVCRRLRDAGIAAPVLMLTASADEANTIAGLEAGANDYIAKPYRIGELIARIRAHLRHHEQSEAATFRLGPYEFRPAGKLLLDDAGKKVRLTEKETNILKYLYRAVPRAVAREELLAEVWGYNAGVTTHTLETHVYRLRQKIEPDPANSRLLLTEAGGYRLQP